MRRVTAPPVGAAIAFVRAEEFAHAERMFRQECVGAQVFDGNYAMVLSDPFHSTTTALLLIWSLVRVPLSVVMRHVLLDVLLSTLSPVPANPVTEPLWLNVADAALPRNACWSSSASFAPLVVCTNTTELHRRALRQGTVTSSPLRYARV